MVRVVAVGDAPAIRFSVPVAAASSLSAAPASFAASVAAAPAVVSAPMPSLSPAPLPASPAASAPILPAAAKAGIPLPAPTGGNAGRNRAARVVPAAASGSVLPSGVPTARIEAANGSSFARIQSHDASTGFDEREAALNVLFENSARHGAAAVEAPDSDRSEIGRASCRERV